MIKNLNRKTLAFALALALLCLATIEFGLQVASWVSPRANHLLSSPWEASALSPSVADERLEFRPNPKFSDHDRKGFRNTHVPGRADIVALGDSQTYGTGVEAEFAWPRLLDWLGEPSVYSMAFGGYGPAHSLVLWDEAMGLEPAIVIEALYSGNDLYDSFHLVYNLGQLSELKSQDEETIRLVTEAEASEPIAERVSRMFRMGADRSDSEETTVAAAPDRSLRTWIARHSKAFGLLRRVRYEIARMERESSADPEIEWQRAKDFADRHPEYCQVFSGDAARTVFTPEYRLSALDLDDPRIQEGRRISLEAVARMQRLAAREGIRFVVLLIPTKELVFSRQAAGISTSYDELTRKELQFWEEARAFLSDHAIEFFDALPALQAQLVIGPQPYRASADGHPNEQGHRVIAETLLAYLNATSKP